MMSLCRTLLGFADPDDRGRSIPRRPMCGAAPSDAAGLRCVATVIPVPLAHVVESAAVGPRAPLSSVLSPPLLKKAGEEEEEEEKKKEKKRPVEWIDDGTRGLSYLYGRDGGGRLQLCTESLGFESCCDGLMGVEEERAEQEIRRRIEEANMRSPDGKQGDEAAQRKATPARSRTEKKEFPPPLTWMSGGDGGRFRSFLKAVRKDGRFLLQEVRVERPEVFRASRQCGRLRLELVKREPEAAEDEEEEAELEKVVVEKAPGMEQEAVAEGEEEVVEEELRWMLPATKALERRTEGGGGFRSGRCQELAREGLPSSSFWVSRFLTTA
ncbi:hypothetical protein Taro_008641 [Colocasia esculenta]|uniref:FAF domain-containing protein n=1 Tax=Colocasia esculenta TaxID=4460 RepID=A0A843U2E5_COLES|nr:hypothetical protein [Colocasia esculenta]